MGKSLGLSQGHSGFLEKRKNFPFEAMMYFRFFTKKNVLDDGRTTNMFFLKKNVYHVFLFISIMA